MINEVIKLKEGTVLKDNEAKDEIIKFFKFIQQNSLQVKDFNVNKYDYKDNETNDDFLYELSYGLLNMDNIIINDNEIKMINLHYYFMENNFNNTERNDEFKILLNNDSSIWYRFIKDKNSILFTYGIEDDYKMTFMFSW